MHPRSHCGGDTHVNWGVWCGCHHHPSPNSPVPRAVGFGDKFILLLLPCSAGALHLPAQGWDVGTWEVCGQFNRSEDSRGGKKKINSFFFAVVSRTLWACWYHCSAAWGSEGSSQLGTAGWVNLRGYPWKTWQTFGEVHEEFIILSSENFSIAYLHSDHLYYARSVEFHCYNT